MAKSGVVTFSNTIDNYGQVLQYLAIQEYLKTRGHEVSLLRIDNHIGFIRRVVRKIKQLRNKKSVKKVKTTYDLWSESSERNEKLHPRFFEDFRQRYFNISYLKLPKYNNVFDALVVGSDQIWSGLSSWGYLNFARYGEVKFTIAPSIGKFVPDENRITTLKSWLADYSFITCREQSAVDMCKKAGREDAQLVLDPTFLISPGIYLKYASKSKPGKEYIFLYLLGADIQPNVSDIYKFAEEEGLEVKYVASQGREDEYPKEWATISEWLTLLSNAKYVFTNSFHGMALSCIFQKQFLVFPIVGEMQGMNERIFNIAHAFHCEDRIYRGDIESVKNNVETDIIKKQIASNRMKMCELLNSINY